jgi:preprotein translocase subunit SecF
MEVMQQEDPVPLRTFVGRFTFKVTVPLSVAVALLTHAQSVSYSLSLMLSRELVVQIFVGVLAGVISGLLISVPAWPLYKQLRRRHSTPGRGGGFDRNS